ncbi:MAG: hypothetical protein J7647_17820 [Cyanobacteria bacterium SBLK]|nr:hypothetical protein [Cyanobacteria bacterium SBLK]
MTTQDNPCDRLLRNPNDREALEELYRLEDELGDNISAGCYADRPSYLSNFFQYGFQIADRAEQIKDFLRSELQADEAIADPRSFWIEHFQHPPPEVLSLLEEAVECEEEEVREAKAREAIALAKSRLPQSC